MADPSEVSHQPEDDGIVEQQDIQEEIVDEHGATEPMSEDDDGDEGMVAGDEEPMAEGSEMPFEDDSIQGFFDHKGAVSI
jgi:hypothetical protein